MGMDVYGKNPTNETGEYLRHSVWSWRPLAELVTTLCPKETAACQYWQTNDGDGLDAKGSLALADALADKIATRQVAAYVAIRNAEIEAMPDEPCSICNGTGVRTDRVGQEMGQHAKAIPLKDKWRGGKHPRAGQIGWCNGCDGRGVNRPWEASYTVTEEDVTEFVAFLRGCGGFEIG